MFYLAAYARHTLRFTREQNKHNGKQDIIISATWQNKTRITLVNFETFEDVVIKYN